MIQIAEQLGQQIGVAAACRHLKVSRSSLYRTRQPQVDLKPRPTPERTLTEAERVEVRDLLNSDHFQDETPRQVYATLLDEGIYLCHWRTMYRILAAYQEVRDRRNQLVHPSYQKPQLVGHWPQSVVELGWVPVRASG